MKCTIFLLFLPLLAIASENIFEFVFWPGPGIEQDSRVLEVVRHPCGTVAVARVLEMPPLRKDISLQSEKVVEVTKSGVVNRWAMPVDSMPIGVKETDLLIVYLNNKKQYWIDRDGRIRIEANPKKEEVKGFVKCDSFGEFGESAYTQCRTFTDPNNGKNRTIAYQGPCT